VGRYEDIIKELKELEDEREKFDEIQRLERNRKWMEEEKIKKEIHKKEISKLYGVVDNPKLDLLYDKAWDLGHSIGFNEVEIHFADLADLIK
jgi:hypothetical protein